ncbi:UNVERIFIED_CONTAM: Copia protein [Sesamum calycinum]|uniref:Copia protein n=1 Tax=Sesamum calycinum TaxID=2727403 RepID=A0AAW2R5X5_9LAMI
MRHVIKLSKKQSPKTDEELKRMSNIPYASAVGSIQYVVQCTRPDVAYALSVTNRYQACASKAHWSTVKTILKYLKRTKDIFLIYGGRELILEGYNYASFQSNDAMPSPSRDSYSSIMVVWEMVSRGDVRMDRVSSAELRLMADWLKVKWQIVRIGVKSTELTHEVHHMEVWRLGGYDLNPQLR